MGIPSNNWGEVAPLSTHSPGLQTPRGAEAGPPLVSIQRWWDLGSGARGPLACGGQQRPPILDHQALSANRCLAPWVLLPGAE